MKVVTISKEDIKVVWKIFDMMETNYIFSREAYNAMCRIYTAMLDCEKEDGSVDMIETDTNKDE
jgi:hypothetical protein